MFKRFKLLLCLILLLSLATFLFFFSSFLFKKSTLVYISPINRDLFEYDDYHKREIKQNQSNKFLIPNVLLFDRYIKEEGLTSVQPLIQPVFATTIEIPSYWYDLKSDENLVSLNSVHCDDLSNTDWLVLTWDNKVEKWDKQVKEYSNKWGNDNVTFKLNKVYNNTSVEIENNGSSYILPFNQSLIEKRVLDLYTSKEFTYWTVNNFGPTKVYCLDKFQ